MKLLLLLALLLTLDACQNPSRVLAALHQDQFVISLKTAGTSLGFFFLYPLSLNKICAPRTTTTATCTDLPRACESSLNPSETNHVNFDREISRALAGAAQMPQHIDITGK